MGEAWKRTKIDKGRRMWEWTTKENKCSPVLVFMRDDEWSVCLAKCEVIIWHPSCLCSSVQLSLANKEDKSTVNMTLNHQTLLLFFLLRLNCVFVTTSSGDLLGNSECFLLHQNHVWSLCLLFVLPWFICMQISIGLHHDLLFFSTSVAQEHIATMCVFIITNVSCTDVNWFSLSLLLEEWRVLNIK